MGKISNPSTISTEFKIPRETLDELGVIDTLLNTDTLLFIDPMLLEHSCHKELSNGAMADYVGRFEKIIKLLTVSNGDGDVAWRSAKKLFKFSEISWTCLGYGATSKGSGFGKDLTETTIKTAYEIVQLGATDVDLFMALALFEEGIGPDRISDMTTNIILPSLIKFSQRINEELKIATKAFSFRWGDVELVENPYTGDPLLFVPQDIVRDLPIANDWSDISRVVRENENLREDVNAFLGEIWANMSRKHKAALKKNALRSKEAFDQLLRMLREVDPDPYDFVCDRNGESFWTPLLLSLASDYPLNDSNYAKKKLSKSDVLSVVNEILEQFRSLIEDNGMWKLLWDEKDCARKEKAAQRLFFVVATSYCKANNIDLSPEVDSGNGPVDFKLSQGHDAKIAVEIKLSSGTVVHGYEKQLEIYKRAENTDVGIFLIIDIGGLGKKHGQVQRFQKAFLAEHGVASDIWLVDGNQRESASKRK